MGFPARLHIKRCIYSSRLHEKKIRRLQNTNVFVYFVTAPVYIYQNIRKKLSKLLLLIYKIARYFIAFVHQVNLYAGSLFVNESLGLNLWYSIIFILAMTALITISGIEYL